MRRAVRSPVWFGLEFYEITKGIKKAIWNSARGRCLLSAKLPLHLTPRLQRAKETAERNRVWCSARIPKEAKWINIKRSKKVSSVSVENVEVQRCLRLFAWPCGLCLCFFCLPCFLCTSQWRFSSKTIILWEGPDCQAVSKPRRWSSTGAKATVRTAPSTASMAGDSQWR